MKNGFSKKVILSALLALLCGGVFAQSNVDSPYSMFGLGQVRNKTMNTLLHVFEAYTELYRVTKDALIGDRLAWMMDLFAEKIYNPELHRQEVFFDR